LPADWPVWSPDSERIYFSSLADEAVYAVSAEGGPAELIARYSPDFPFALPWSILPDGETLAILYATSNIDRHIATLSVRPGSEFREWLRDASLPAFSPNGSWMAYQEGPGPASLVHVRPYPDAARALFLVAPGREPVFSRDGRELFYFADDALWSASVQYEPALRIGTPEVLFRGTYRWGGQGRGRPWDPHPDGERFLMIAESDAPAGESPAQSGRHRIHVVVNWAEELTRRVAAR
jgi:hypothetical protein